jgi:hypothetical protein
MTYKQAKQPRFIKKSPLNYRNNQRNSNPRHLIELGQAKMLIGVQ